MNSFELVQSPELVGVPNVIRQMRNCADDLQATKQYGGAWVSDLLRYYSDELEAALRAMLFVVEKCEAENMRVDDAFYVGENESDAYRDIRAILLPTIPAVSAQYPCDAARLGAMEGK